MSHTASEILKNETGEQVAETSNKQMNIGLIIKSAKNLEANKPKSWDDDSDDETPQAIKRDNTHEGIYL